eukprot:90092_1
MIDGCEYMSMTHFKILAIVNRSFSKKAHALDYNHYIVTVTMQRDFAEIGSAEESFLAFGFFFLNPIGFFAGCLMVIMLIKDFKNDQIKIRNAACCAICAMLFQILLYFNDIFLSHDLIIKWNYSEAAGHWATFTDVISTIAYGLSKILFYFAFTFHVLSVFKDQNDRKISSFLRVWMIAMGVICVIIMIVVTVDDATSNSPKETGVTSPHNLYVTMVASHAGAQVAKYSISMMILVDIIYFLVLIVAYIKKLKNLQKNHTMEDKKYLEAANKGVTLMIFSCFTFWVFIAFVLMDIPLKWWGALDITSDALCLFLMFHVNEDLYRCLCGCCHRFWNDKLHGKALLRDDVELSDKASADV